MLLLIISEYYCPTTFLPLANTSLECSCPICLCSKGWLNTREAVPGRICSSPNNQRFSLCSSWNLSNPLPTHTPTICFGLFGAVTVPVWEQLHTAHPQTHVKFQSRRRNCGKDMEISPFLVSESFVKISFLQWSQHRNDLAYKMLFFFLPTHASKHTPCPDLSLENAVYC